MAFAPLLNLKFIQLHPYISRFYGQDISQSPEEI